MRLEVGGASVLGGVPSFPCCCVVSPLPLLSLGSLSSLSLFHHNPPHEQLLIGLEAGGALLSVICHSFIVLCHSFIVVRHLLYIVHSLSFLICRMSSIICCMSFVPHCSSSVVCCLFLVVHCLSYVICSLSSIVCRMSFIHCCQSSVICCSLLSINWHPLSLPIRPASSGLQWQG
jgi:hypothetical protein